MMGFEPQLQSQKVPFFGVRSVLKILMISLKILNQAFLGFKILPKSQLSTVDTPFIRPITKKDHKHFRFVIAKAIVE